MHPICRAIRERLILELDYGGRHRVVVPYCHGESTKGVELFRAVQIAGESASGGLGFGKLWSVERASGMRVSDRHFVPDDPQYNPQDSAMRIIHCRV
jgi:hypothetical protein